MYFKLFIVCHYFCGFLFCFPHSVDIILRMHTPCKRRVKSTSTSDFDKWQQQNLYMCLFVLIVQLFVTPIEHLSFCFWAADFTCLCVYVKSFVREPFLLHQRLICFCAHDHRVPKIESRYLFISLCCWFKFLAHQLSSMIFVSLCFCAVLFFPTPIEQWGFFWYG